MHHPTASSRQHSSLYPPAAHPSPFVVEPSPARELNEVDPHAPSSPLFASLDNLVLKDGRGLWVVTVFAIYEDRGYRWVQLGLAGHEYHTLVLRLDPNESATEAVEILASWIKTPFESDRVQNVL